MYKARCTWNQEEYISDSVKCTSPENVTLVSIFRLMVMKKWLGSTLYTMSYCITSCKDTNITESVIPKYCACYVGYKYVVLLR